MSITQLTATHAYLMVIKGKGNKKHSHREGRLHVPSELPKEIIAGRTSMVHLAPLVAHQPTYYVWSQE